MKKVLLVLIIIFTTGCNLNPPNTNTLNDTQGGADPVNQPGANQQDLLTDHYPYTLMDMDKELTNQETKEAVIEISEGPEVVFD